MHPDPRCGSGRRHQCRSANLLDWEHWQALILGATPSELSDLDAATVSRRFYRAVTP
ncbi:MAG TPA: hypothetical protein VFD27_12095 [Chthoniobacteraceae bacterium]|jgi:hypothetical protein|nr:hypothetical protein [Chthoniobacteraceae bacterium]